jgi:hypothetical protein
MQMRRVYELRMLAISESSWKVEHSAAVAEGGVKIPPGVGDRHFLEQSQVEV